VLRGKRVRATGIVLVETADALPEVCSTVVTISEFRGTARYSKPQIGVAVEEMIVTGVSEGTARHVARQLARYDDPEVGVAGSDIPRHVAIGGLLGLASFDSGAVIERWATYDRQVKELAYRDPLAKPSLATRLGRSEDGVVTLDIVNDGPHGLVGGTSGSGKTELLRGFVLGLALEASPTYLNFFFIDYKGAAGFGALSRLPHTVGMATNLSPALTERALAALKSELDYRLRKFRSAPGKVEELHQYWMATDDPLPRLVVVIDELAELKDALPEFITTLVRIGRIGRTLGIHLVTATQRPGEVVKGDLRENTNFSIALRVNEPANSVDLIGVPDASTIPPRGYQGRAYLRIGGTLGPPPVLFQSALSSGRSTGTVVRPVSIAPFRYGTSVEARSDAAQPSSGTAEQSAAETDLERLVAAAIEAFGGAARPRSPWTDPLPELLALDEVLGLDEPELTDWVVPFAIADDVANQSRRVAGWDTKAGNLLVYGILGSGTTTTLKSVAVSLLTRFGPARSHVYVIDAGAGELRELERVPGVGAVVTPSETERQVRLVGYLLSEIQRRRESPRPGAPLLVLVVDNFGRLAAGDTAADVIDGISRIFTEGPDVGVLTAASADRGGAISMRLADLAPQKWVLRLADKGDYTGFGLPRRDPADLPPGRAVVATSGLVAQIAVPDLAAIAERLGKIALERDEAPRKIEVLADSVTLSELVPYLELGTERWFIPVGRGHERLDVVGWTLAGGDHAMVIGPPRSGKSSFLAALASVIRLGRPDCFVGALTPRPTSPLATSGVCDLATADVEELWTALAAITNAGTPRLVLIDDAHLLGDESGRIEAIVRETGSATHIVAAARTDDLRQLFGHWSQAVRRGRNGLVLRVSQAIDGDPINARLPMQRTYDSRPGRGYISCDGDTELVQVPLHASPDA
jgi:S-DNA-T family DNA segregation ATPase FtsK/SpoIIIE